MYIITLISSLTPSIRLTAISGGSFKSHSAELHTAADRRMFFYDQVLYVNPI